MSNIGLKNLPSNQYPQLVKKILHILPPPRREQNVIEMKQEQNKNNLENFKHDTKIKTLEAHNIKKRVRLIK